MTISDDGPTRSQPAWPAHAYGSGSPASKPSWAAVLVRGRGDIDDEAPILSDCTTDSELSDCDDAGGRTVIGPDHRGRPAAGPGFPRASVRAAAWAHGSRASTPRRLSLGAPYHTAQAPDSPVSATFLGDFSPTTLRLATPQATPDGRRCPAAAAAAQRRHAEFGWPRAASRAGPWGGRGYSADSEPEYDPSPGSVAAGPGPGRPVEQWPGVDFGF